ncbi:MAG: glutamine--tRNA ligase/YqeY domain fusion protein [Bacteroidota bacterium]|nr:glutamine--tRNA ligase/YqeY domain fusion protein [Bacteroidota bacterium]
MNKSAEVRDFIRSIIDEDLRCGTHSRIAVRFPPEPNGYLHIGHAKSSTLNFGLAAQYGGRCHLRFDDTNPLTEEQRYVDAIKRDLRWLGFDWGPHEYYASDYFPQLYAWACELIRKGLAYVDDSSEEQIRDMRGTVNQPGRESPFRERSPAENLELFERMRAGEFADGSRVLRARIDMAHANMKMRDPLMYRVRHATHYRQVDDWCIYPFYDWAHGQSDAIENITHSICTLEFATNRVLYDWYLDALGLNPRPRQYEFARFNMAYTITSKRKLRQLVQEGFVDGWNDPRMPTLAGLRRRGVTPEAIRNLCISVGTTKVDSTCEPEQLAFAIRNDLNRRARRVMCVLNPLPIVLTNWSGDATTLLEAPHWPHDIDREGSRKVPLSRHLLIERSDFAEDPPKGFRRLIPGGTVRLRHAFVIRCDRVDKDHAGRVFRLHCTRLDRVQQSGAPKVRGTIHWVDARTSLPVEVRSYDRLFSAAEPGEQFLSELNPSSLVVHNFARIEPCVRDYPADTRYQFIRLGYYWQDPDFSRPDSRIYNCIVPLRDSWKKPKPAQPAGRDRPAALQDTPALTAAEQAWLMENGLSAAVGLAIRQVEGGEEFYRQASRKARPQSAANWMANHLLPALNNNSLAALPFDAAAFATLVNLVDQKKATADEGRAVLAAMITGGGTIQAHLRAVRAQRVSDPAILAQHVDQVLEHYADRVRAYHKGKHGLAGFFVGQVLKRVRGQASPHQVKAAVEAALRRT